MKMHLCPCTVSDINLLKFIFVSMPSHDVIEDAAEKVSVSMCFTFGAARQRPRYVTENLHTTTQH